MDHKDNYMFKSVFPKTCPKLDQHKLKNPDQEAETLILQRIKEFSTKLKDNGIDDKILEKILGRKTIEETFDIYKIYDYI